MQNSIHLQSPKHSIKALTLVCALCAFIVIGLGAYARLTDAGLGCPDWPGCYGSITVPKTESAINGANHLYPERPVEQDKAFNEMIHRYIAGLLGILIFTLTYLHFKHKTAFRGVAATLSLLVIGQALLGMWTVTLSLFPTVVSSHLLGGFTIFSLLFLLTFQHYCHSGAPLITVQAIGKEQAPNISRSLTYLTLFGVITQIFLGGWTASNYAATVCTSLPICEGEWWTQLNFIQAFKLWGHGVSDYEFATHISPDVKITIHALHRIGAIIVSVLIISYTVHLWRQKARIFAAILMALLTLQILLGITNVVAQLPLYNAVAHNLVGALLMSWMITITYWVLLCQK